MVLRRRNTVVGAKCALVSALLVYKSDTIHDQQHEAIKTDTASLLPHDATHSAAYAVTLCTSVHLSVFVLLLLLVCVSFTIIGQPRNSVLFVLK